MSPEIRQDEVLGKIDQRLMVLENDDKWEKWFKQSPGIVLALVITTLCSACWMIYTWQMEEKNKSHNEQLEILQNQNKERINWLKEQQKQTVTASSEKCTFEKQKLNNQILQCNNIVKKHNKALKTDS
jgi:hypothetical protein